MSTPGPLIRVTAGTDVRGTLHNSLDKPLIVSGFGQARGMSDSVVDAGRTDRATCRSRQPRRARTTTSASGRGSDFGLRAEGDMQLVGAIVVDPADAPHVANDRVFVISWNGSVDTASKTGLGRVHDDDQRTLVAAHRAHRLHAGRLDPLARDQSHRESITRCTSTASTSAWSRRATARWTTVYAPAQQRLAVTEVLNPFQTMTLSWMPDRPGNWIYHCHYAVHLSRYVALDSKGGAHGRVDANGGPP